MYNYAYLLFRFRIKKKYISTQNVRIYIYSRIINKYRYILDGGYFVVLVLSQIEIYIYKDNKINNLCLYCCVSFYTNNNNNYYYYYYYYYSNYNQLQQTLIEVFLRCII